MKVTGGFSSLTYSLGVAREVGTVKLMKTLFSRNSCKACALGMGGVDGAMRNESGDFPEVCKKGIQAQLTDIQTAIPLDFFRDTTIADMRTFSSRSLERLGRLNTPLYKKEHETHYTPVTWEEALSVAFSRLKTTDPSTSFFYSSGRASNEAAFLLQLFGRLIGTSNITNCAMYCHQATGVALKGTIGTGTATVELNDIKQADLIFVFGANPSSNHPRLLKELIKCRRRGGEVIIVNPIKEPGLVSFALPNDARSMIAGGSPVASEYIQLQVGGDIAFIHGVCQAVLEAGGEERAFIGSYTNNFEQVRSEIVALSWDEIVRNSGVTEQRIRKIARLYMNSSKSIFAWAMGITQHTHGVENIEAIVNLALLRGMIGKEGAGLMPIRGHSNVQGVGSVGVYPSLQSAIVQNIERYFNVSLPVGGGMDTMSCMQAALAGNINMALLMGGNLYASNPDSKFAEKALDQIPFKLYLTTTINKGHVHGVEKEVVILPVAARDEEKQGTTQESMFNFVRLSDGGINRLNNVRSEVDILCDLAEEVMGEEKVKFSRFKDHGEIRNAISEIIPGFEEIRNISKHQEFHVEGRVLHQPVFPTSDGKAAFSKISIPTLKMEPGQFRMATIRSEGQFNSIVYDEFDLFRGQSERWVVLMNPEDMNQLGISEDDKVTLLNETGKMEGLKARPFNISRGNVATYYPEGNLIVPVTTDPRSKTPSFKSTVVSVIKE
ncbi:FdhF/YdeP family oxidoreductase [Bacteroidota bacterium]